MFQFSSIRSCKSPILVLQAEAREKERMKEDHRKQKKLESGFRSLLRDHNVDYKTDWTELREKIQGEEAFRTLPIEADRLRVFKEYQQETEEACSHHHTRSKKSKKNKKQKRRSHSRSVSSVIDQFRWIHFICCLWCIYIFCCYGIHCNFIINC